MSPNPRTLKLTIKDLNENNVEQELAIVNSMNDIINNFSEQLNHIPQKWKITVFHHRINLQMFT